MQDTWLRCKHYLKAVLVGLVETNVIVLHIRLWYWSFLNLISPESKDGNLYQKPLFTSTRSNVWNSSPYPSSLLSVVTTPWWVRWSLVVSPWVVVVHATEQQGAAATRMIGVAGTHFFATELTQTFIPLLLFLLHLTEFAKSLQISWDGLLTGTLAGNVSSVSGQWGGCKLSPVNGALAFLELVEALFSSPSLHVC